MRRTTTLLIGLGLLILLALGARALQREPTLVSPNTASTGATATVTDRAERERHPWVQRIVDWSTVGFELAGVGVIVIGTLAATAVYGRRLVAKRELEHMYAAFRSSIGRSILLGLELLVAADIINTVAVRPTLTSVAVLGLIVLIRTFLSFSLEVEIEGRWPWEQRRREEKRGM